MKYFLAMVAVGIGLLLSVRVKADSNSQNTQSGNIVEDTKSTEIVNNSNQTIAVRNNNPLNIRVTSDNWLGLANPRSRDGFFNFTAPEYGFRAAKVIMLGAYAKRGIKTVSQIISTWAPPFENKTAEYIRFVVRDSGLGENQIITSTNIRKLLYSMARMESGKYYSADVIDRGLTL